EQRTRADKFWKRTGKKISIQGSDVVGFDKSKIECFNCHKMGHFVRECRAPRSQERVRKKSYRQGSKAEEKSSKALMAIDGVGWDWSYMANEEDHALVADGETPTEFALMANNENKINKLTNEVETLKEEKDVVDGKLAHLRKSIKDLEDIIESQRSDQVKEGVGYNDVPPHAADLYRYPKKDLSWTGLPEFADNTVTDYSRPTPIVESTSAEGQNKHSTTAENGESTDSILSKPAVKFVKAGDRPAERPTANKAEFVKATERPTTIKVETTKKPAVRYAEMYRRTSKRSTVRGNQRN
nr:hypothetical protein [Tanacetum cinerariifolium]